MIILSVNYVGQKWMPKSLNWTLYFLSPQTGELPHSYRLISIVSHIGSTSSSGKKILYFILHLFSSLKKISVIHLIIGGLFAEKNLGSKGSLLPRLAIGGAGWGCPGARLWPVDYVLLKGSVELPLLVISLLPREDGHWTRVSSWLAYWLNCSIQRKVCSVFLRSLHQWCLWHQEAVLVHLQWPGSV